MTSNELIVRLKILGYKFGFVPVDLYCIPRCVGYVCRVKWLESKNVVDKLDIYKKAQNECMITLLDYEEGKCINSNLEKVWGC